MPHLKTEDEISYYFQNIESKIRTFSSLSEIDDLALEFAFGQKYADLRKYWLAWYSENRKTQTHMDTSQIKFVEFVNNEIASFLNLENDKCIPCLIDGLRPSERQVLFTCLNKNFHKEQKLSGLVYSILDTSVGYKDEKSISRTIIGLAQDFIGTNNINLLLPLGQFGTRINGDKVYGSPQDLHTCLNPITRYLFCSDDDPLYERLLIAPCITSQLLKMGLVWAG